MIEYKNILYCTDFSEDAEFAFLHAQDLAKKYNAKLYILHILHSPYKYMRHVVDEYAEPGRESFVTEKIIDAAKEDLKRRYVDRMEGIGSYEIFVKEGAPWVEIVKYAKDQNIDLIVMGTAGSSELERIEFGSTVENVARRAHCHVIAIRNPEKRFTLPGTL